MKVNLVIVHMQPDQTRYKVYDTLLTPEKRMYVQVEVDDAEVIEQATEGGQEEITITPKGLAQMDNQIQVAYYHGELELQKSCLGKEK